MKVIETAKEMQDWRRSIGESTSVGFVPTMGALHEGHGSLVKMARKENDFVITSIFVNPTQFNSSEDLKNYPRTWKEDQDFLSSLSVDVIFLPSQKDLYPDDYSYRVSENRLSGRYCGAHRPGHFDGVLSVVMKLFQITRPTHAYFGEKDFQQLRLIEGMIEAYFLPIQIRRGPTLREVDGLAMSSRNRLLTPEQRSIAPMLYQALTTSSSADEAARRLKAAGFQVDYVEDWDHRRLAAATLGNVRLIDNVELKG